jgi:ABC-2 type transport system permease protein
VNPLQSLLRADMTVQLRGFRSWILTIALPLLLLIVTSKGANSAARLGGADVPMQLALTVGLVSTGVIGYSLAIARDRDKGVLQRLRVTPAPTWTIMSSRCMVQIVAVLLMSVVVLVVAHFIDKVTLSPVGYVLTVIVTLLGSAMFLSIGQAIAALIPSADTLNAAGRLLYVPLIVLSVFGQSDVLGTAVELISRWSPGGCLEKLFSAVMGASAWTGETWLALLVSVGYTVLFGTIGIRWFRWTGR